MCFSRCHLCPLSTGFHFNLPLYPPVSPLPVVSPVLLCLLHPLVSFGPDELHSLLQPLPPSEHTFFSELYPWPEWGTSHTASRGRTEEQWDQSCGLKESPPDGTLLSSLHISLLWMRNFWLVRKKKSLEATGEVTEAQESPVIVIFLLFFFLLVTNISNNFSITQTHIYFSWLRYYYQYTIYVIRT